MDFRKTELEIINKIKEYDQIILLRHVLPDGDAYGFQFAMRELINLNWPGKKVLISGKPNNKLNFIGKDFNNILDNEFEKSLVIVGDTANTPRIDEPNWDKGKYIIKIDHHPNRDPYGDLMLVRDDYVATSEIIGEFIMNHELKINKEIARILYHGIITDSERFMLRFPQPRTLRVAAFLLEQGFDLQELYSTMYSKNESDLKLISYVYENYEKTKNGVAYLKFTKEILNRLGYTADEIAYDKVSLLSNIKGINIWAFFCEYDNQKTIRVELRSTKIKINDTAEIFGGGGHSTSAGIKVDSWSKVDEIIKDLDNKKTT